MEKKNVEAPRMQSVCTLDDGSAKYNVPTAIKAWYKALKMFTGFIFPNSD